MKIHPTELHYDQLPSIYPLLEATGFMWFVVVITIAILVWVLNKLWYIHSLPKHLAKEKGLGQAKLIFWLCMIGLFYKPLWIIAVLIIVTDWNKVQQWIRGVQA